MDNSYKKKSKICPTIVVIADPDNAQKSPSDNIDI